jgi:hypothetical protein
VNAFARNAAQVVAVLATTYGDAGTLNGVPVVLIVARVDPIIDFPGFSTQVRSPGFRAEVRQAEYPTRPQKGDAVVIPAGQFAGSYAVKDVAEDGERLQWTLDMS